MCRQRLGLTTINPENDVVRVRIVPALKEKVEEVSRLDVNVTCVSSRQHLRMENGMQKGGLTLRPVRIQKLSSSS